MAEDVVKRERGCLVVIRWGVWRDLEEWLWKCYWKWVRDGWHHQSFVARDEESGISEDFCGCCYQEKSPPPSREETATTTKRYTLTHADQEINVYPSYIAGLSLKIQDLLLALSKLHTICALDGKGCSIYILLSPSRYLLPFVVVRYWSRLDRHCFSYRVYFSRSRKLLFPGRILLILYKHSSKLPSFYLRSCYAKDINTTSITLTICVSQFLHVFLWRPTWVQQSQSTL